MKWFFIFFVVIFAFEVQAKLDSKNYYQEVVAKKEFYESEIQRILGPDITTDSDLLAYEAEFNNYLDSVSQFSQVSMESLLDEVTQQKVVLLSDVHGQKAEQKLLIELMMNMELLSEDPVLVLEWLDRGQQSLVNSYLNDEISLEPFISQTT